MGIDHLCSVRVDPESDGGCADPSDRGVPRSARDCTSVGLATRHLYASLPTRTAVVIFFGHSDPLQMASLNVRKVAFESAIKSGKKAEEMDRSEWWTASDGRALEEIEKAKRGFFFWGGQVDLCVLIVITRHIYTLRGRCRWKRLSSTHCFPTPAFFSPFEHVQIMSTCSPFGMADINTRRGVSGTNSLHLHSPPDRQDMEMGAYL